MVPAPGDSAECWTVRSCLKLYIRPGVVAENTRYPMNTIDVFPHGVCVAEASCTLNRDFNQ